MSSETSRVLCYGGITAESTLKLPYQPKPGIAHIIAEEYYRLGGGAANVAQWLGNWGVPTRITGTLLGYDHYGDVAWKALSKLPALDLQFIRRDQEASTLIARSIPFPDGNTYLFCSDYAAAPMVPPSPELLDDVQVLEISFYFRNPSSNAAASEMARLAQARGIKIVAMDIVSLDHETLPLADVIINSSASIIEQNPNVDILEHCRALQRLSQGIVIATDGGREIHAIDQEGAHYSLLPPKVQVTDATGAGDSFRAGIVYGLVQGWPLEEALRWAAAVGALQVQRDFTQDHLASVEEITLIAKQIRVIRMN